MAGKPGLSGRKPGLTPEVIAKAKAAIGIGAFLDLAARFAGVEPATFHQWLTRGRRESTGIYRELFDAVQAARPRAAIASLANIEQMCRSSLQANTWRLERMFPEEYAKRDKVEMSGPNGGPIEAHVLILPSKKRRVRKKTA